MKITVETSFASKIRSHAIIAEQKIKEQEKKREEERIKYEKREAMRENNMSKVEQDSKILVNVSRSKKVFQKENQAVKAKQVMQKKRSRSKNS